MVVGHGADQGYFPRLGSERQQRSNALDRIVLEQNHGLIGHLARQRAARRRGLVLRSRLGIRVVKQSQRKLHAKHAPHGFIHNRFRNLPRSHLRGEGGAIEVAFRVHVYTGFQGLAGRGRAVCGNAVVQQFGHRGPIRDHETAESPLLAQNLSKRQWVGRAGNAVDRINGAHHRRHAGIHRGQIGFQIHLPERDLAHIRGIILAARDDRAVSGKMLHAGRHRVGF